LAKYNRPYCDSFKIDWQYKVNITFIHPLYNSSVYCENCHTNYTMIQCDTLYIFDYLVKLKYNMKNIIKIRIVVNESLKNQSSSIQKKMKKL